MAGGLSRVAKKESLATIRDRYRASSRKNKSRLLDEFIQTTGPIRGRQCEGRCPPHNGSYFPGCSLPIINHTVTIIQVATPKAIAVMPNTTTGVYPLLTAIGFPRHTNGSPVSASRTPFTRGGFCSSAQATSNWACVNPRTDTEYEAE